MSETASAPTDTSRPYIISIAAEKASHLYSFGTGISSFDMSFRSTLNCWKNTGENVDSTHLWAAILWLPPFNSPTKQTSDESSGSWKRKPKTLPMRSASDPISAGADTGRLSLCSTNGIRLLAPGRMLRVPAGNLDWSLFADSVLDSTTDIGARPKVNDGAWVTNPTLASVARLLAVVPSCNPPTGIGSSMTGAEDR